LGTSLHRLWKTLRFIDHTRKVSREQAKSDGILFGDWLGAISSIFYGNVTPNAPFVHTIAESPLN
jgi:hypothetical protein